MPAKMETSVGMFQAMDVASDDAPIVETCTPNGFADATQSANTKLEDNLPTKREQSSSNKAATLIGATTSDWRLLWMNRSGSRIDQPKPTAQKRRARRS